MKKYMRILIVITLLIMGSNGAWATDLDLKSNISNKAYVTFYTSADEPTADFINASASVDVATKVAAGNYVVMHIEPAAGWWTNEKLLFSYETKTALARTRAPGLELGQPVTLLKADEGHNDGAGWYYYQVPAAHDGYTSSIIDGYVVEKFNLANDPVTKSGTVFTVKGQEDYPPRLNGWTAEFTYSQLSYKFDASSHKPTLRSVVIKKDGTKVIELTKQTDISKQVHVPSGEVTIFSQHSLNLEAASYNSWFMGSVPSLTAYFAITVPFKGSGTKAAPWQIETAADLNLLARCTNVGEYSFNSEYLKQMAAIDMSSITDFQPIGKSGGEGMGFRGSYNGDGKTIKNLTYQKKSADANGYAGLFGYVEGGTVQNVVLENCQFSTSYQTSAMGGIAGYVKGGTLKDNRVTGACSISNLKDNNGRVGAVYGRADGATISGNTYDYDVTVSRKDGSGTAVTAEGYQKRGTTVVGGTADSPTVTLTDVDGAMLYVMQAILPTTSANGSTVAFNETIKGTNRYDKEGDDFYYAVGQPVTLTVTTGSSTDGDIRTFYDELATLTMNGTDIKQALGFTMPAQNATVDATFTPSYWFIIDSNQKQWMTFYHDWGNYEISDGAGTGKTIKVLTISNMDSKNMTVTATDLEGVCYQGMPSLFYCEGGLPKKLKFTPTTKTTTVTAASAFQGGLNKLSPTLQEKIYLLVGSEFLQTDIGAGESKDFDIHKCIVLLSSDMAGSRLVIVEEGGTGIDSVQRMTGDGESQAWYLLDGRKLNAKPSRPGLYINNGKKVVIK